MSMSHGCMGHMGAISFVSCEGASLCEEFFWHATDYCVTLRASLMVPGQKKPWRMTFVARALGPTWQPRNPLWTLWRIPLPSTWVMH